MALGKPKQENFGTTLGTTPGLSYSAGEVEANVASGVEFGGACMAAVGKLPQVIGNIQTAIGCGTIRRASGIAVQVMVGDPVCQGDVIETAADGRIEIRFIDGAVFNLSRDARMVLSEFARDSNGILQSALFAVTRGTFAFTAGRLAKTGSLTVDTPVGSIRSRAQGAGIGILSFAALIFSFMKEAQAADPNVTFLDDDTVTYKDLEHGVFELITKEAIPRHIIVEDPGETIVLSRRGSSVSVSEVANSPTRMQELQAAQQDVLANFAKGLGPTGSSTPPFVNPQQLLQPINFIQTDPTHPQNSLFSLEPAVFAAPEVLIIRPTLAITSIGGQINVAEDDIINAAKADAGVEITGATSGVEDGQIVKVSIIDGSNHVAYSGTATVNGGSWSIALSPAEAKALADGIYTLTAEVSNATGHSADASQPIRVDETPPTIAIDPVARNNVVNADTASAGFVIVGTTSDAENGQPVTVRIVDGSGHVVDTFVTTLTNNTWSISVTSTEARLLHDGSYTVTADVSDSAGNTALEATQAITVDETLPAVTWLPPAESGIEGAAIALGTITAIANSLPGHSNSVQSLVVSSIPVGAVLTDGTNSFVAASGSTSVDVKSWTLSSLEITPPNDTNFTLSVTATDQDANTASTSELVTAAPLAPTLNPVAAQGNENTAIALDLGATARSLLGANGDASPNSLAALLVSDIPVGATLSDGTGLPGHSFTATAGNTVQDVASWNLSSLTITPPTEFEGSFTLTIAATERDSEGDLSATTTATTVVTVAPVAEPPTATGPPTLTLNEDATGVAVAGVSVGPLAEDTDDTVSATLTVSHGTLHVSGTSGVTVSGDDSAALTLSGNAAAVNTLLAGLTYTPTTEYEGSDTLVLSVTSSDGASTYPAPAKASTAIEIRDEDDDGDSARVLLTVAPGTSALNPVAGATETVNGSGSLTGTASALSASQTFTSSPATGAAGNGTSPMTATGVWAYAPDNNSVVNPLNTGGTLANMIIAGLGADLLKGGNGSDTAVHSPVAVTDAAQFDTITDFVSGSDKIDLTAFGSLASAILALTSASTSVPAHTIAWLSDSKANQALVYVNPTDHTLSIGDSGLVAIHLPGVADVHLSDFVLTTTTATIVAPASDPIDHAATPQDDATIVATTTAADASDTKVSNDALFADGDGTAQTTRIHHSFDTIRDNIDAIDDAKSAGFAVGWMPPTENSVDGPAIAQPSGLSIQLTHVAMVALMQPSFAFDQKPVFDNAKPMAIDQGAAMAPASGDYGAAKPNDIPASTDPHEDAAVTHGLLAISKGAESPDTPGDSFHFKNDISSPKGSGLIGVAELGQIPASIVHHEDGAVTQLSPAISVGAPAIELPSPGQHPDHHLVPDHAPRAFVAHLPHDLIV
ncbi:FecR family protein [Bradyrhizobium lablabi]|nr:FecR family protein [Bradyrhizobium lablabi]